MQDMQSDVTGHSERRSYVLWVVTEDLVGDWSLSNYQTSVSHSVLRKAQLLTGHRRVQ